MNIQVNDVLEKHRQIVQQVILHHASLIPKIKAVDIETKFDDSNNQYMLVKTGWKNGKEIQEILIFVILRGKGVEIKVDKTKKGIVKDLIKQGIIKDYISLPRSFFGLFAFNNLTASILNPNYTIYSTSARTSIYIVFFVFLLVVGIVLTLLLRYNYIFYKFSFVGISVMLIFGVILGLIIWSILDNLPDYLTYVTESNYQEALNRTAQSQDLKPAWDISTATLSAYFNRNLRQIDWIFRFSVIVMLAGFGLVGVTIALAYQKPNLALIIVGSVTGTLTQIIGVIFLFIYRSSINQANQSCEILTITNYIGTAMQILDGINQKEDLVPLDKLIDIKMEIVKLLLANAQASQNTSGQRKRRRQRKI
jgi:XisI protein